MAVSDTLKGYDAASVPPLKGSQERYLASELQRVSAALNQAVEVIKILDAKQVAHGW